MTHTNPEQPVIDAIDALVTEALAQPIVDDYEVNRYERCELCRRQWHGLPEFVMLSGGAQTCPGAWATDEDKAAWAEMFAPEPSWIAQWGLDEGLAAGWQECGRISEDADLPQFPRQVRPAWMIETLRGRFSMHNWRLTNHARAQLFSGRLNTHTLDRRRAKVALFYKLSNVHQMDFYNRVSRELRDGGGYKRGGMAVQFVTDTASQRFTASFRHNPSWTASGHGFVAYHAAVIFETTGEMLCTLDLGEGGIAVQHGSTLTIDSSTTPLITLEASR